MTAPPRRTVISGSAVAVVGAVGAGTAPAAHAARPATDLLRRSRFTQHVGSTFTMTSPAGRWSVVLDAVEDLAPGGVPGAEKQFAAAFSGAGPGDGVYSFARKGFAATPLFIVAGGGGGLATVNCI